MTAVLEWEEIRFTTKKGTTILSGLHGVARPGTTTAILGPSGSGKTIMLNILAGRVKPTQGTIRVNGKATDESLNRIAAYVPQDEALLAIMNVARTVKLSAKLQMKGDIDTIVEETIHSLGLNDTKKTRVGGPLLRGCSGGERRRVAIAVELVSAKPLLFMDVPTKGLDSAAAYQVIKFVSTVAKQKQRTVICTIDQPSSNTFQLFDNVIVITGGQQFYFGPVAELNNHLTALGHPTGMLANVADHALRLVTPAFDRDMNAAQERIEKFAAESRSLMASSNEHQSMHVTYAGAPPEPVPIPNFFSQMLTLILRGFINAAANPIMYWARIAMYMAMAILVGSVWFDLDDDTDGVANRLACHFYAFAFLCFMMVAGIPAFLEERSVFIRENKAGYCSAPAYVLANTITSLLPIFLMAVIYTIIAYPMIGLNPSFERAVKYVVALFLALVTAESMVMAVTAWVPIFVAALTLCAFANGFFMVVMGYFVRPEDIPPIWRWAQNISYQRYTFEAVVVNDFEGLVFNCPSSSGAIAGALKDGVTSCPMTCMCVFESPLNAMCQFTGYSVMQYFEFEDVSYGAWMGVQVAMAVGFRLVMLAGLIFNKRP